MSIPAPESGTHDHGMLSKQVVRVRSRRLNFTAQNKIEQIYGMKAKDLMNFAHEVTPQDLM